VGCPGIFDISDRFEKLYLSAPRCSQRSLQDAFGALAKNRHGGAKVRYAWKRAEQRIRGAKFHDVLDSEAASDTWGETTDTDISITRGHAWLYDRYTDQLVDTLLHEALHYCAYFERPTRKRVWRELSADDEHLAMRDLGLD